MTEQNTLQQTSIDEQIREAINREKELAEYYKNAIGNVGSDAEHAMRLLHNRHRENIELLERLLIDIEDLRELSIGMVG